MYTPAPATSCTPPSPRSLPQKLQRGRCRTTFGLLPLRRKIMASSLLYHGLAIRRRGWDLVRRQDDVVDEPVGLGLLGREEVVALSVLLDALDGLAGVPGQDAVQQFARAQDLLGVDLDVRRLALHATPRLMDEDVGVRQGVPPSRRAAGEEDRSHRVRHADADRGHRRADVLHRVVDGETGGHLAAR